jgi:outer membrane protein OmpA-like peptidoglycan-associated protein
MADERNSGLGNHPIVVIAGLVASISSIFVFLTGKTSLPEVFSGKENGTQTSTNIVSPSTRPAPIDDAISSYTTGQKLDLNQLLADNIAAGTIRVDNIKGDEWVVVTGLRTAFDVNSAKIKPDFYNVMDRLPAW